MEKKIFSPLLLGSVFIISACSEPNNSPTNKQPQSKVTSLPTSKATRWYNQQQVNAGEKNYQIHCASCHKPDASGTTPWDQADANGKYPPPPLDGSAHTWHHHLKGLRRTVRMGGAVMGGSMPGFANKLSSQEIDEVLAWVQSHWSDKIYASWKVRDDQAKK